MQYGRYSSSNRKILIFGFRSEFTTPEQKYTETAVVLRMTLSLLRYPYQVLDLVSGTAVLRFLKNQERLSSLGICWIVLQGSHFNIPILGTYPGFAFGSIFSTGWWQRAERLGTGIQQGK